MARYDVDEDEVTIDTRTISFSECNECGAIVNDEDKHSTFHRRVVSDVEITYSSVDIEEIDTRFR